MPTYELHPLAKRYPRMTGKDFDLLVADIREHGVREPIVLLDGKILDGGNRYEAARIAGKNFRIRQYDPQRDGKDPAAFVKSRNDRRRHYTPEQRRQFLEASIKADPGKSDRQHALAVPGGADHKTARRVRRQLEATGEIATHKKTVGADGKARNARQPKPLRRGRPGPKTAGKDRALEEYQNRVHTLVMQHLDELPGAFIDALCDLDPILAKRIEINTDPEPAVRNGGDDDEPLVIPAGFPRPHYFDHLSRDRQRAIIAEWSERNT